MGKIRSMTIEPGKGGFTSSVRRAGTKGNPYPDNEPNTIHPSVQHLQAHVGKVFGGGANRAAATSGGKKKRGAGAAPGYQQVANGMLSGPGSAIGGGGY